MANLKDNKKQAIVTAKDFNVILRVAKANWWVPILVLPVFYALASFYNYRLTTVYKASTEFLLKSDDTYYKEHERLNGESILISQQIGSVNDAIEKINESVNYHKGLHRQWFGTAKVGIKPYSGRVELQELERLVAEIGLIQEIDPKVGKVTDEAGKRMEFLEKQLIGLYL